MCLVFSSHLTSPHLISSHLISSYLIRFKYEIKIDFVTRDTEFPAITLCNILPWSMSAAAQFLQNPNTSTYQWHHLTSNLSKFDRFAETLNRTAEFDWVKNRLQQPQVGESDCRVRLGQELASATSGGQIFHKHW